MPRKTFLTSDGAELSYIEEGQGRPLLMIPGWSQTAEMFKRQIAAFSKHYRVIAADMRGHGESANVDKGYRIQRLATDIYELCNALDLNEPDALGHSMGSSLIWAYMSMFGSVRPLGKLVFVDEAPAVTGQPGWDEHALKEAGCLFASVEDLSGFCGALLGAQTAEETKELIRGMFTSSLPEDELDWIAQENVKLPRAHAADLLHDHSVIDWRRDMQHIGNPALVIGGEVSVFSAESQQWMAEQLPDAQVEIFAADAGGGHFMFWENASTFNALVLDFLAD